MSQMAINYPPNPLGISQVFKFTAEAIEVAPRKPGVFVFLDERGAVIQMGSSLESVQSALRDH